MTEKGSNARHCHRVSDFVAAPDAFSSIVLGPSRNLYSAEAPIGLPKRPENFL